MEGYTDSTETKPRYIFALSSAYLGSYAVGAALGYSSPVTGPFKEIFTGFNPETFGSIIALGAMFGGLVAGYPVERFGRKFAILLAAAMFSLGWVFMWIRTAAWMLYLSRFVLGVAIGIDSLAVPVYLGEVSPTEKRGISGAGHQFNCVFGILVTYSFGCICSPSVLAITCMVPVVLNAATIILMPESPTWLVKNDKPNSEVMESLYFLHGRTVRAEAQRELLQEAQENTVSDFSFGDLFDASVLKPLLLVIGLHLAQQGSGINAVVFYTEKIFKAAGVGTINPGVQTVIVGAVMVLFTVPGALLMDKAGRRILLLISSTVTIIGTIFLIVFYAIQKSDPETAEKWSWLPMAGLSIYVAGFSCGLGPVPWITMSELLPARARGTGTAIATASNWLSAFVVTYTFPKFLPDPGAHFAFGIYVILLVLGILLVLFGVPETKGRSLEEIEAMFLPPRELNMESVDTVESATNSFKIQ